MIEQTPIKDMIVRTHDPGAVADQINRQQAGGLLAGQVIVDSDCDLVPCIIDRHGPSPPRCYRSRVEHVY